MAPLTQPPQLTILNRDSHLFDILLGVSSSTGVADAFKPVVLDANGVLDPLLTGTGVIANASASLAAGSLVNLYNVGSVLTARPASANVATNRPATGFVVDGYATNDPATVYLTGRFNYLDLGAVFTSSDIGSEVYLSATTPGAITKTAPIPPDADQVIGYVISFQAGSPNIVTVSFGTGVRNFAQIDGVCQINQGGTSATTATAALTNLLAGSYATNQVLASPASGGAGNIALRGLVNVDLAGATFVASGAGHKPGAVPDPGASAGTTKFLREDATFAVPTGTPASPANSIQFNNAGAFGGDASFEWDNINKVLDIGPTQVAVLPASVPQLQITGNNPVQIETNSVFTFGHLIYVDNPTVITNAEGSDDAIVVSRNYNPSGTVPGNFLLDGITVGISTDPANTQNQTNAFITGFNGFLTPQSAAALGTFHGVDGPIYPSIPTGTMSIVEAKNFYGEILMGDGVHFGNTMNITLAVGLNAGTHGWQTGGTYTGGTITNSWGVNVEGPRVPAGTAITHRYGIRMAQQSQNAGGTNNDAWAIFSDTNDQSQFGVISQTGSAKKIVTKVATYAATKNDHTINCNGTFTLTLPTTGLFDGQEFYIKNIGTGTITVSSAVNIDGALTVSLNTQYQSITVQWDATANQYWIY